MQSFSRWGVGEPDSSLEFLSDNFKCDRIVTMDALRPHEATRGAAWESGALLLSSPSIDLDDDPTSFSRIRES